ncbi:hypothetical protein HYQ46_010971 [Verticillium longisporum]|nr:hypothetical protein HYQ46_010971 [Verticillium longisporum]
MAVMGTEEAVKRWSSPSSPGTKRGVDAYMRTDDARNRKGNRPNASHVVAWEVHVEKRLRQGKLAAGCLTKAHEFKRRQKS